MLDNCPNCGDRLREQQVAQLGQPGYNEWYREGYCSLRCYHDQRAQSDKPSTSPDPLDRPTVAESQQVEAAQPEVDEVEDFRKNNDWFALVHTSDGQLRLCDKKQVADTFRKDILDGVLNAASAVDVHAKTKDGQWSKTTSPLTQFAKGFFKLRVLYEPVWSHAMTGLTWGALTGIGLKFLDTLILLGSVDPGLAFLFVVVAAVCAIPRIGVLAMIGISIVMMRFAKANLFVTLLAVMATGSILGCLPGMAIGGAIGLGRKKNLPLAPDAKPEGGIMVLKALVLPLLGAAALWALYLFVFNPWMANVMSR
jgi:hypothetical protein